MGQQPAWLSRAAETSLGILDDVLDRLRDALVVHCPQRHTIAPAHFLQNGSALVRLCDLWRRSANDLAVMNRNRRVILPSFDYRWEENSVDPARGRFEEAVCVLNRGLSTVQYWVALPALASRLGLDVELESECVDYPPGDGVHGHEVEAKQVIASMVSQESRWKRQPDGLASRQS